MADPHPKDDHGYQRDSVIRRSWHAMSALSPFSSSAVASLPKNIHRPVRHVRADGIPEVEQDNEGQRPAVRDYHAINVPEQVRVPKKIPTSIKVEGKVWFANERTWIAWLNTAVLIATLALALFNASKDQIARNFAYTYAAISLVIGVYGYVLYQHRITMIRRRDPGHFDFLSGPVIVSMLLFFAILSNFVIRVRELERKGIPVPGSEAFFGITKFFKPSIMHTSQKPF